MTLDPRSRVYFIGGEVGCIKIGTTVNVFDRIKTLQCGSPIPLFVMATAPGGVQRERYYHQLFDAHRQHGEWFTRCPEIEAEIAAINKAMKANAIAVMQQASELCQVEALGSLRSNGFPPHIEQEQRG